MLLKIVCFSLRRKTQQFDGVLLHALFSVKFFQAPATETLENFAVYGRFRKQGYPQIIQFNRDFHYKPSILGYPYFWKHSYGGFLLLASSCRGIFCKTIERILRNQPASRDCIRVFFNTAQVPQVQKNNEFCHFRLQIKTTKKGISSSPC